VDTSLDVWQVFSCDLRGNRYLRACWLCSISAPVFVRSFVVMKVPNNRVERTRCDDGVFSVTTVALAAHAGR
jgi:hypothetical protein